MVQLTPAQNTNTFCWRMCFPFLLVLRWLVRKVPCPYLLDSSGAGNFLDHPCGSHWGSWLIKLTPSLQFLLGLGCPGCSGWQDRPEIPITLSQGNTLVKRGWWFISHFGESVICSFNKHWWRSRMAQHRVRQQMHNSAGWTLLPWRLNSILVK